LEGNLTPRSFLLLLISITLGSFGQICLKAGMMTSAAGVKTDEFARQTHSMVGTFLGILRTMGHPFVILGLSLYVISTLTWLLLLSKVRLSVAYPMISISYVFVVILSSLLLRGENVAWGWAIPGLLLISGGVSIIGFGLGRMAQGKPSGGKS
jgi:drug/metabolite transporter (DMT)-like permease